MTLKVGETMNIPHADKYRTHYQGERQKSQHNKHRYANYNDQNRENADTNTKWWSIIFLVYGAVAAIWLILWAFETAPILTIIGFLAVGYFFINK